MKYFIQIFIFLVATLNSSHAEHQNTEKDTQDIIQQLEKANILMQDTINHCKQVEDRNKDDDVDLDFINNLFQQNNKNIQFCLKNDCLL